MTEFRHLAVAGVVALAVLAPNSRASDASARVLSTSQRIVQIESTTRSIRDLRQDHAVKTVFAKSAAFNRYYAALAHKDSPDSEINLAQRELVEWGWIRKTDSYRKIAFQGMANQVIGFYDPVTSTLYVRSDNNQALGVRRDVIAHEYTHALQDQHFNLRKLMPDQMRFSVRNSDRISAIHALTEGDAVTTQVLFVLKTYPPALYAQWRKIQLGPIPGPKLPTALERDFNFPYNEGFDFVWKLYKSGGMSRINAVYGRLPNSTYVVMYPHAYQSGWRPVAINMAHVTGMSGWKQVDDDVFGAWEYKLLIWETMTEKTADAVARMYRGDRYIFLERGAQNAMLMRSVWTSHSSALAAQSALLSALRRRFPHPSVTTSGSGNATVRAPGVAVAFSVDGTEVRMAYGPTTAVAKQLMNARTS